MPTILWKNILKCLPTAPTCLAPLCQEHAEADWSQHNDVVSCCSNRPSTVCSFVDPQSVDLQALAASNRFFISSPGLSNSIARSTDTLHQPRGTYLNGGVAVKKYSLNPHDDFKRSMEDMIEAKLRKSENGVVDCDYLNELLSCYLTLNPKNTHKFVVAAFADVMTSFSNRTTSPATSLADSDGASTWW